LAFERVGAPFGVVDAVTVGRFVVVFLAVDRFAVVFLAVVAMVAFLLWGMGCGGWAPQRGTRSASNRTQ
jgi:hypothetical protein